MSALPRPDLPTGPHRDLNDALHDLHHQAGWPSLRALATDAGCSHTTVSKTFSSTALPTWGTLELLVEGMQGDTSQFRQLWLAATTPVDRVPAPEQRIAGRRAELSAVRRHFETGHGLLLVTGEAGIGKTALVTAAATRSDTFVATGHCLPLSTAVPFLPIIDVLRTIQDHDDGQWLKEALAECPGYMRSALGRLLPELDPNASPSANDEEWGRHRLFISVASVLRSLAVAGPFGALVEDLHWADDDTLDLLEHLLSSPLPPAVVGTWREEDPDVAASNAAWSERLLRSPAVQVLRLGPLDRDETAEHLELLTGGPPRREWVDRVHQRSGGIPLFSEQLVSSGDHGEDLPRLLSELLDRRLANLDGDAWVLARVLAVADRPLGQDALTRATGLDSDLQLDVMRHLDRARILTRAGPHAVVLRHPLLAEAIRRRLLGGESASTHGVVAEALADLDGEPGEIARHWAAAGEHGRELTWRIRAARRSQSRASWPLEREEWRRVLELWPPGQTALGEPPTSLADVYERAMILAEIGADVPESLALAHRAVALELPAAERAAVLSRAGGVECAVGDADVGLAWLTEAIDILEQQPVGSLLVDTLVRRAWNQAHKAMFVAAGRDIDRALAIARETVDDPLMLRRTLGKAAWLQCLRGALDLAMELAREAWSLRVDEPDPFGDLHTAIDHTDLLLHADRPPAELTAVAVGPLEAADRWDIDVYAASVLRYNVCESLLRSGAVTTAGSVVDPHIAGEVEQRTIALHVARACIDVRRGHIDEALARFADVEQVYMKDDRHADADLDSIGRAEDEHWYAEAELWADQPARAVRRLAPRVSRLLRGDWAVDAAHIIRMRARASADLADSQRATDADRGGLAESLVLEVAGAAHDPFGTEAISRAATAHGATWRAEVLRIGNTATVEAWVEAAASWDRLTRPHDAAYCRWRAAQVALRDGQGTVAARLLKRAAADAREHVPLRRAIADTVAGAR